MSIWAIVLAAGESRRMGRPKPLIPFSGTTVIEHILGTLRAAHLDGVLVVLGAEAEKVAARAAPFGVRTTLNADYRLGMLSSVQQGFRALPASAGAALVFLVDQPAVSAATVKALVRAFVANGEAIAVPTFGGRRGHPLLLGTGLRDDILKLDPEVGLRQLLRRHAADVLEVPVRDSAVLRDMDTPADLRREKRNARRARTGQKGCFRRR